MTRVLLLVLACLHHSCVDAQRILVTDQVTIKTIETSPQRSYIGRTNLYLYQLQIYQTDSLWGTNVGTENGGIKCFSLSHDEQYVALGTYKGYVEIWHIKSAKRISARKLHKSQVNDIVFTTDDTSVITADPDGNIQISATDGLIPIRSKKIETNVNTLELISGEYNLLASGDHDGNIAIWTLDSLKPLKTWRAHDSYVFDLKFSADDQTLFSAGHDKLVKLWDPETTRPRGILKGHHKGIFSIDLSADGRMLASGGMDNTVIIWSVAEKKMLKTYLGHTDYVTAVRFLSDSTLLSGSRDHTLRSWAIGK